MGPPNIPTVPARGQTSARMLFDAPRSCVMRATSREIYIYIFISREKTVKDEERESRSIEMNGRNDDELRNRSRIY